MRKDFPGQYVKPLTLSKDEKQRLADHIDTQLTQIEKDRAGLENKWKDWRLQASSRRPRKGAKARDAQIDMPLTRERQIQDSARLLNPIFQQDMVYTSKPRTPGFTNQAKDVEALLDDKFDKIDTQLLLKDFIKEFQTVHCGIIKTPFVEETRDYRYWQKIDIDEYDAFTEEGQKTIQKKDGDNYKYFVELEGTNTITYGCQPEVVKLDDFFFPITAKTIASAEIISHRVHLTKSEAEDRIREGLWDKGSGDAKTIDILGNPSETKETAFPTEEKAQESPSKQYAVHECYLRYKTKKDEAPQEVIVTYDKKSKTILRAVYNFYQSYHRPFITHSWEPVLDSILGEPLTYLLEPLHIAYSASIQQRLDAASKANETMLGVPPGSGLLKRANQDGYHVGIFEMTGGKEEYSEFGLSQPFTQLPDLEQLFAAAADRLMGLSGYSFGDEQISRPTATGQIQVIEEGKQPQYVRLDSFRKTLQLLAMHVISREKQFNPDGLTIFKTITNPQTGEDEVQRIPIEWPEEQVDDYAIVEVKVTSAQMSKNIRKQEVMALADKIPQMYQTMMGMAQSAVDPNSPVAMISAKLLNGYQVAIDEMLVEFEVAKKGQLNPELIQEVQVAQNIQQMVQQLQGQIQQLQGQAQSLGQENQQLKAVLQGGPPPAQSPGGPGPQMGPPPNVQPGGPGPAGPPMPPQGPMPG